MKFEPTAVTRALQKSWSSSTASQWTKEKPAAGQYNVTALLVCERFGGQFLKTPLSAVDHFYNRVGGCRYEFTDSQFDEPITYLDLPATQTDAEHGATATQLAALWAAFGQHYGPSV